MSHGHDGFVVVAVVVAVVVVVFTHKIGRKAWFYIFCNQAISQIHDHWKLYPIRWLTSVRHHHRRPRNDDEDDDDDHHHLASCR